jgi:hypothetical protein
MNWCQRGQLWYLVRAARETASPNVDSVSVLTTQGPKLRSGPGHPKVKTPSRLDVDRATTTEVMP